MRIPTVSTPTHRIQAHGRRFATRAALLWLVSIPTVAAEPFSPPAVDRRVDVAFGVANQWGFAGSAAAWAPALAERLEFTGELGQRSRTALGVELLHARPLLANAAALVPDSGGAADTITGWRDELSICFVVRVPIDAGLAAPALRPIVGFFPTFALSGGALITDAHLALVSFTEPTALRSRALTPLVGARLGVEARVYEWLSLVPHAELTLTFASNGREQSGGEVWGAEGRVLVGADAVVRF